MSVARVEIYVKSTCGFCFRAKALLDAKDVDYEEYELTWGSPLREEMIQRARGYAAFDAWHVLALLT